MWQVLHGELPKDFEIQDITLYEDYTPTITLMGNFVSRLERASGTPIFDPVIVGYKDMFLVFGSQNSLYYDRKIDRFGRRLLYCSYAARLYSDYNDAVAQLMQYQMEK